MRLPSKWILALAVGLAVVAAAASAAVAVDGPVSRQRDSKTTADAGFFISGIVEVLLRPLKQVLVRQINSVINSIIDQGGMIIGNAKRMVDELIEVIRPFIIIILDQINNIIGTGVELKDRIRMAVEAVFEYLGVINNANKNIVKSLINYIVDKLLPTAIEMKAHQLKTNTDAGFFISGIVEILLRPLKQVLLAQVNSIINSIIDQGGMIIGNAKKLIDSLLEIIRPFIIRILDQINNIIGAGVELKERLRMAVEAMFDFIGVIGGANKEILKSLINYIVEKLLPTASEMETHRLLLASPELQDDLKARLVAPIRGFAFRQLGSAIRALVGQGELLGELLLEQAGALAETVLHQVAQMLELEGKLHEDASQMRETVRALMREFFEGFPPTIGLTKELITRLVNKVTDILVSKIVGNVFLTSASRTEALLIIDRIIGWIVQPILNKINSILDQIRTLVEDKTDEAKAKLMKLFDELTELLKDPVLKIIGVLGDIGIEIGDLAKAIKRSLEMLIDSVSGIHEANKAIFKSILSHIISSLLGLIQGDVKAARAVFDFSILTEIISRILEPIIGYINGTLEKLRQEIESKVGEAADLIRKAVDQLAATLAPYIASIVRIFLQIGIGSIDLVENVRIIMQLIVDGIAGIAEANRRLLAEILGDLMRRIIEIVGASPPRK